MLNTNASHQETHSSVANWIESEFATLALGDRRRNHRVKSLMTQFAQQPAASIPLACGDASDIKAAYRFFDNQEVSAQALLQPHIQSTIKRMQTHSVVLALQDTTALNYSKHFCTQGLGPIVNRRSSRGYFLHATFVVSPKGAPLGCLAAHTFNRSAKKFGTRSKSRVRNNEPIAQKESQRWIESLKACEAVAAQCPNTRIVNIADREADIYELFAHALENKEVHLLIRVQHNRNVAGEHQRLWQHLERQPTAGMLCVEVPRCGGQPARKATLSVRFCALNVSAPCLKEDKPALALWAIEARELHPPRGSKAILWRLLTTMPVEEVSKAIEYIGWYARRWKIEVLHKVLKSGCNVEGRQLQTRQRLDRALMLALVVAWRVMHLTQISREQPQQPATLELSEMEVKVLCCRFRSDSARELTLEKAMHWVARMGGFLGRKSDGNPGPITLWRGLRRLNDLAEALTLLQNVGNV
jgi:hypothetical protein